MGLVQALTTINANGDTLKATHPRYQAFTQRYRMTRTVVTALICAA